MVTPKPYNHILETSGQDCAKHDTVTTTGRPGGYGGEKALLPDPAPSVNLLKCAESSMDFSVRVWVSTADYWPVNFRMVDNCKRALDRAGITIPYPQMDIHMK